MDTDVEFDKLEVYLKYCVDKIVEKHDFNYHQKVNWMTGKSRPNWMCGIGKIFHETETCVFTRQFNGVIYDKEKWAWIQLRNEKVRNGLYLAPYYGNEKKYDEVNN